MKRLFLLLTAILLAFSYTKAQDIIVQKDGTILNVYNLEESDNFYFYSLEPSTNATIQKISKDNVFSIKKDGKQKAINSNRNQQKRPAHEPVTAQLSSEITQNKKGQFFTARTPDEHELNYHVLSSDDHTLAVCQGKYHETEYIIPEYVQVGNDIYTITEIEDKAFYQKNSIHSIQFPSTLRIIGKNAFTYCPLQRILLPDGLQVLADAAFSKAGWDIILSKTYTLREIYIPSTIQEIGHDCFRGCGADTSPRGFCQAYFSNMPDFITEGNCKNYGIDEEAVRAHNEKKR